MNTRRQTRLIRFGWFWIVALIVHIVWMQEMSVQSAVYLAGLIAVYFVVFEP